MPGRVDAVTSVVAKVFEWRKSCYWTKEGHSTHTKIVWQT